MDERRCDVGEGKDTPLMSFGPIPPTDTMATVDQPDAASLRVALSMIDDWDHEFSSLFELETTPSQELKTTPRSQRIAETAPYKPRRVDARKQEAQELRDQMEELQRVLNSEKARFVMAKTENSIEARALEDECVEIVKRQETQRFAAQVENEKLRALVETQRRGAHKIVQLAQRVAMLEQVLPTFDGAPFENYQGPREDPQAQLARLGPIEQEALKVFTSGAFAKNDRKCFREVEFRDRTPDADGLEVTFEMAWMLPFSVDEVAEALWIQSTRITSKDRSVEWMDLYEDATAIVSQFISTPLSNDNPFCVVNHGQIASRRLPKNEQDGSIVFVANHQARSFEHGNSKGVGRGDAWIRIERAACHKPTARISSPLTHVKWSRRFVIRPSAHDCMTHQERKEWVNAIIAGPMRCRFENNLDWTIQAVENILLARAHMTSNK